MVSEGKRLPSAVKKVVLSAVTPSLDSASVLTDCGTILEWNDGNQPECPDWFAMGGYYYLIYSIGGYARYLYSTSPFDGWIKPEDDKIPCGRVPKAACLGDRRIFAGFVTDRGYAGDVIFADTVQNEDGTLAFVPVEA